MPPISPLASQCFLLNPINANTMETSSLFTSYWSPIGWYSVRVHGLNAIATWVSSRLTWSEHIDQVFTKPAHYIGGQVVGMLHRQFYSWANTSTLLLIYLTCIKFICMECACQLWNPFTSMRVHTVTLEAIQKFACRQAVELGLYDRTVCCSYSSVICTWNSLSSSASSIINFKQILLFYHFTETHACIISSL